MNRAVWRSNRWFAHPGDMFHKTASVQFSRAKMVPPTQSFHNDVIKWKHYSPYWPFVRRIHRHRWIPITKASHAELWCFLWSAPWINGWVNNRDAGDLRRHRAHYDVIIMGDIAWFTYPTAVDIENITVGALSISGLYVYDLIASKLYCQYCDMPLILTFTGLQFGF